MTDNVSLNKPFGKPLSGLHILVTRPAKQAAALIQQLEQLGATVLHQPAIQIEAEINDAQNKIINSISNFDWVIFISKNAVEYGLSLITKSAAFSQSQQLAAIGQATRDELIKQNYTDILCPDDGFDSESLLKTSELSAENISDKQILIVRGGKGREHLKDTLEHRGAKVTYLDVYQRTPADRILSKAEFASLNIITISSQQGLENIVAMQDVNSKIPLFYKTLISPSLRCSEKAKSLGFNHIETAANATDNAMLNCIVDKITNNTETSCNESNHNN